MWFDSWREKNLKKISILLFIQSGFSAFSNFYDEKEKHSEVFKIARYNCKALPDSSYSSEPYIQFKIEHISSR